MAASDGLEKSLATGEDKKMDEEVQGEGEQEEDEDGEPVWQVREITRAKVEGKKIVLFVTWDLDGSTSWEPLENFPEELNHEVVKDFVNRFPDKWATVQKNLEKKTRKNWTYTVVDADMYEKPDESAPKEAKRLADPNRLEDPTEKWLKTYGEGIEGRLSRSKAHAAQQNISGVPSVLPVQNVVPEEKKENKKRGRKPKEESSTSTSKKKTAASGRRRTTKKTDNDKETIPKQTEESDIKQEEPSKSTEEMIEPVEEPEEKSFPPNKTAPVPSTDGWQRKHRDKPLNSSDEEEGSSSIGETMEAFEPQVFTSSVSLSGGRIEAGANSRSLSPVPNTAPSTSEVPVKRKKTSVPKSESKEHRSHKKKPKAQDDEEKITKTKHNKPLKVIPKDPRVRYADEPQGNLGIEKAFAELGITISKENPKDRLIKEFETRKMNYPQQKSLDLAIRSLDAEATKIILMEIGPKRAMDELRVSKSLHEVLTTTYEQKSRNLATPSQLEIRQQQTEKVIRAALPHLPQEILVDQNDSLNTLLHCAINTGDKNLVEYLIKMGSPLHVRNCHEMTAAEACVVMKNSVLLSIVLRHGGTFHHICSKKELKDMGFNAKEQERLDHFQLYTFLERLSQNDEIKKVKSVAIEHNLKLQQACDRLRRTLISSRLLERELGPLMSFPRGNIRQFGSRQTIQFTIPELWVQSKQFKFMLAVIPMTFDDKRKLFVGTSRKAPIRGVPYLCGYPCKPMTRKNLVFYRATTALRKHVAFMQQNGTKNSHLSFPDIRSVESLGERERMIKERNTRTISPMMCTLSIEFEAMIPFSFFACQLIRYVPDKSSLRSTSKTASRPFPTGSSTSGIPNRPSSNINRPTSSSYYRDNKSQYTPGSSNRFGSTYRPPSSYQNRVSHGQGQFNKPYNRPNTPQ
ncbi:hypothetical protein L5515_001447 [Caenorhabditis briggsae]|uniref:Uncharacterized protein n=2 Tax=Caenorhabditis briggsae TaxID=6238 RepID=A0AAE9DV45_CAEBR|nr:hypothetical protein L3Y34_015368 [Caenorhabditis briggsae]UMM12903.1 hypothetical protein L5515_001447 [Caenorhabditis briggsae]